jgi:DNA polymerase-3 subunit beta
MHIRLEKKALAAALAGVQAAVERRNTIPILSNVLLSAGADGLTLKATDLDLEISDTIPADVLVEGQITAPAGTLSDIVRKLPDGAEVDLRFNGEDPRLVVSAGRAKFNLPVLPAGDFPEFKPLEVAASFEIKSKVLLGLLDRVRFAMSSEETRYYLNGVYVHVLMGEGGSMLRAIATDGHRLALAATPAPQGAAGMVGMIIPRKTVGIVVAALETAGETVTVRASGAKIEVNCAGRVIRSKLIDGHFPDYERVIPKGNTKAAKVDPQLLTASVDRVASISADKTRSTKLHFTPGRLELRVRNMEAGAGSDDFEIDYDGAELEVGMNARYLMDVSRQCKGDWLTLQMEDALAPVLCTDSADPHSLFVLMPLRV